MADEAEQSFLAAQKIAMQEQGAGSGEMEGSADTPDSDDYDPSATLPQDFSVPTEISQEHSAFTRPVSTLPEDASAPHALLSPSQNRPSSTPTGQDLSSNTHFPTSKPFAQTQPRLKGGFVIEDEDDEVEEDEVKDGDVYDSADGMEAPLTESAAAPQTSLNSFGSPQVSIQGDVQASLKANIVSNGAASDVVPSSTIVPSGNALPRDSTVTPAQSLPNTQVNIARTSSNAGTPTSALPKARLAHDTIGILEDRIKEDPRGDMDAWLSLLVELRSRNKRDEVRSVYKNFFKTFPFAAEQWASYATWEDENNNLYELEQIFARSLLQVPNVQLWQIYLNYIRRRNSMTTGDTAKSYKIISESFNFALDIVGMDKDSGQIWQEYINFIKTGPGIIGGTGWQDTQKMDALRAAYQKAITVPTSALAPLWKEYDGFETGLSKINGRKFLQERSPAYMTARTCYTQIQNMTRDLNRTTLPRLPPAPGFEGEAAFMRQVQLWKEWIDWEKEDNLVLKDDDPKTYRKRILFTYKQALMALQFWPEMWYDAAEFCLENGLDKEGLDFLKQGIAANPESCLLAFKMADRIELTTSNNDGNDPGAKARMAKVRDPYDKVLNALYDLAAKTKAKESLEIAKIEENNKSTTNAILPNNEPDEENEEDPVETESKRAAAQAQIDAVKQDAATQTALLQKTISYAWIALIRAARRVQGKGMAGEKSGGFRVIFGDARKKGKITSDVYVENALIEYHCYKDPVGTKIFERGMKLFPEDENFALEYLKHLIAINDITNARAVFETTVGKLTASPATAFRAKPIFAFLHEYESHFGELSQVARLEKRMRDLYPEDAVGLKHFAQRYGSRNFDPTSVRVIVSPTQIRPSAFVYRSVEADQSINDSPPIRMTDTMATNSPKRPLPTDDLEDNQPRKIARGESPLKGAAGRRMNQQHRNSGANGNFQPTPLSHVQMPPPAPLPGHLAFLLSIIPKASTYEFRRFDPSKMVELLRNVQIPSSASIRQGPPAPQQGQQWPQYPPQPQQQHHPQPPMMPPGMPPGVPGMVPPQYTGNFRYQ